MTSTTRDKAAPRDLGAPFECDRCAGEFWATIEEVALCAAGVAPLVTPCCGRHFGLDDLGAVTFFSRAARLAASNDDPPQAYRVGYAFAEPVRAQEAGR